MVDDERLKVSLKFFQVLDILFAKLNDFLFFFVEDYGVEVYGLVPFIHRVHHGLLSYPIPSRHPGGIQIFMRFSCFLTFRF